MKGWGGGNNDDGIKENNEFLTQKHQIILRD